MVGHRTLDAVIGVRIPVPQPWKNPVSSEQSEELTGFFHYWTGMRMPDPAFCGGGVPNSHKALGTK